jgi:hypothetical protein
MCLSTSQPKIARFRFLLSLDAEIRQSLDAHH